MDNTSLPHQVIRTESIIEVKDCQTSGTMAPKDIDGKPNEMAKESTPNGQTDDPKPPEGQTNDKEKLSEAEAEETKATDDPKEEPKVPEEDKEASKSSDDQTHDSGFIEKQTEILKILESYAETPKPNQTEGQIIPIISGSSVVGDRPSAGGLQSKPSTSTARQGHDWICFECHTQKGTDPLTQCSTCHRVYHNRCLRGKTVGDPFECPVCLINGEPETSSKLLARKREELNQCIALMINNLQLGYGHDQFDNLAIDDTDETVKMNIHTMMDMVKMRHKALTDQYIWLREAIVDFKQWAHNILVLHRERLSEVRDLERKLQHEIKEIRLCVDCYKYSSDITYDKHDNPYHWFLLVCEPPHELVFAKYQKYPFWPAKVIDVKTDGKSYDVRFFDAPDFSRAVVPKKNVRSIEGFTFDDPDGELELPVQLMEQHIRMMRQNGVYFMPTVYPPERKPSVANKKRAKESQDSKPKKAKGKKF